MRIARSSGWASASDCQYGCDPCPGSSPQGRVMQELRKEVQQRSAEVGAQQMALAGVGGERDACRSAVQETSQRAEVRHGVSLPPSMHTQSCLPHAVPLEAAGQPRNVCVARLQALAAEVVALEEKYLQAKSMELRAVRQTQEEAAKAVRAQQLHASAAAECTELRSMLAALQASPCGLCLAMSWLVANIIYNCHWSSNALKAFANAKKAFAIDNMSARMHCRRRSRSGLSIFDGLQYQFPSQIHSRRVMSHCSSRQMHRQQSHLRMRRRRHLRQGEALP